MTHKPIQQIRKSAPALVVGVALGVALATCGQPATSPPSATSAESGSAPAFAGLQSLVRDVGAVMAPTPAFARATGDQQPATLADVAEGAVASVVNISATRMVRSQRRSGMRGAPGLRDFFGPRGPSAPQLQQGSGSGVIVQADGVILTNHHVVEGAEEVRVTLSDGREFDANVVGTDPQSDLAVLRLKGDVSGLTAIAFGDSSALRLGEVVLAIGNPFGVGQTVTMGIVSAKGRSRMGIVDYEDFIQTDAAINPGNSGGALVNMRGELVGINTAILSRSGGYQGIGFAIPATMASPIMNSLLSDGKVARGWLGVAIQTVDQDLAEAIGGGIERGVLISDITADSPAARAGLKRGDVILALDGEALQDSSQLRNRVAARGPGAKVALTILRDGQQRDVTVELGALSKSPLARNASPDLGAGAGHLAGVQVAPLNAGVRARFNIPGEVTSGVVVIALEPDSDALRAGIRPGDVILEIDRRPVDSVEGFRERAQASTGAMLLLVYRDGNTSYLALR